MNTATAATPTETRAGGHIHIELLALDLDSCTRCVGSLDNIELAIEHVRPLLQVLGKAVSFDRVVIESEAQAQQYHFRSSPTVRINGRNIALTSKESVCDSCSELCGCEGGTQCQVWEYSGQEYTEAPVQLLVEALLRAIVADQAPATVDDSGNEPLPQNLQRFFQSTTAAEGESHGCCTSDVQ
ncbi:MAG: DUF2703 domain-containing protein, partial [Gammaproteobacteria bacterium]